MRGSSVPQPAPAGKAIWRQSPRFGRPGNASSPAEGARAGLPVARWMSGGGDRSRGGPSGTGRVRGGRDPATDYFLRWRILLRMRRFLRPTFRRPLPRRRLAMRAPWFPLRPTRTRRLPRGARPHASITPIVYRDDARRSSDCGRARSTSLEFPGPLHRRGLPGWRGRWPEGPDEGEETRDGRRDPGPVGSCLRGLQRPACSSSPILIASRSVLPARGEDRILATGPTPPALRHPSSRPATGRPAPG